MKRIRRRYVLFLLHTDGERIEERDLTNALWNNLLSIYGEIEAADSRLYLVEYDGEKRTGILQCNASSLRLVITAASLVGSINGVPICFEPKKTAGTIKSLRGLP